MESAKFFACSLYSFIMAWFIILLLCQCSAMIAPQPRLQSFFYLKTRSNQNFTANDFMTIHGFRKLRHRSGLQTYAEPVNKIISPSRLLFIPHPPISEIMMYRAYKPYKKRTKTSPSKPQKNLISIFSFDYQYFKYRYSCCSTINNSSIYER